MDINFDQSIFGQLIQPKKVTNPPKQAQKLKETLPSNILNNEYFNQQLPSPRNNLFQLTENTGGTLINTQRPSAKLNQHYSFGKELSTRSTQVGENMRETGLKSTKIRKISSEDLFPCFNCQDQSKTNQCMMCEGTGYIRGSANLARFIEYVVQFKLGLLPSYQQKRLKNIQMQRQKNVVQSCSQIPRIVCRSSIDNQRFSNFDEFKQRKSIERNSHTGYGCNGCKMYPIIGSRYHCSQPECKDDYDLCQNCFYKLDHEHNMEEIRETEIQKKLQIFSSLLVRPPKQKIVAQKIFSSSIY